MIFRQIGRINRWIDEANGGALSRDADDAMRILKLTEEAGEVAQAYIGYTGQNPRKGFTHTQEDLLNELADVAITALCAIQHFTQDVGDTETVLTLKLSNIERRIPVA